MTVSRALRSGLTTLVAVALALGPGSSLAAPPPEVDEFEDPDELGEARRLFDAGVARYTAADYGAAIDLWLEAYAQIPPTFENRLIKAELIYNVARAQQKWFAIDEDVKHLRQSREIPTRYRGEIDDIYADQAELEREKIDEQIAAVDEQIAAWEAEQARREAELAERMRPKYDEEADARERRRNKAMIGAGAGLTALGIAGVGLLTAGVIIAGSAQRSVAGLPLAEDIGDRRAAISRGQAGNALVITGILTGGVFLAAGVPLLAVGAAAEKRRKQRRAATNGLARLDAVAPVWILGGAGLGVAGRF